MFDPMRVYNGSENNICISRDNIEVQKVLKDIFEVGICYELSLRVVFRNVM